MANNLAKKDWLRAARLALLQRGPAEVRVELLARNLRVTKGSFYWHFKDREDLLSHLLREWESDFTSILAKLKHKRGLQALAELLQATVIQAPLGEKGLVPSDAAMFTWASVSPAVARRVNREEKKRISVLRRIVGNSADAELLYLVWLGFVARGQRVPGSRRDFPRIARAMLDRFLPVKPKRKPRPAIAKSRPKAKRERDGRSLHASLP